MRVPPRHDSRPRRRANLLDVRLQETNPAIRHRINRWSVRTRARREPSVRPAVVIDHGEHDVRLLLRSDSKR